MNVPMGPEESTESRPFSCRLRPFLSSAFLLLFALSRGVRQGAPNRHSQAHFLLLLPEIADVYFRFVGGYLGYGPHATFSCFILSVKSFPCRIWPEWTLTSFYSPLSPPPLPLCQKCEVCGSRPEEKCRTNISTNEFICKGVEQNRKTKKKN